MAKNKIYAVRKGRTQGIFFSWKECESQVKGFNGAQYKSFSGADALQKAQAFITGDVIPDAAKAKTTYTCPETGCIAFVDGSYNAETNVYGSAVVLLDKNANVLLTDSFAGDTADFATSHNVAGEIFATLDAIELAIEKGYKSIDIYYDYKGIEYWATDAWKANTPIAKHYKSELAVLKPQIKLNFHKVLAHSGVEYNEMADTLAKESVGIA